MNKKIEKLAYNWITADPENADTASDFYCQTRDVFQARLEKMKIILSKNKKLSEHRFLLSAIAGEIGNNSFDHNLGNWPNVMGIFFGYEIIDDKCVIALADRGLGVLKTLQRVKPELNNHKDALNTAFTQIISSRHPERRGNGLKFVKNSIESKKFSLTFKSGDAAISINEVFKVKDAGENIKGCLSIIKS
ncbi:MAG: hypothetical protein V1825_01765 [Candidatus Falkowbacteria bacterium]|nr:hypothetical protein [Candidatus Parcubacteria bacterium]